MGQRKVTTSSKASRSLSVHAYRNDLGRIGIVLWHHFPKLGTCGSETSKCEVHVLIRRGKSPLGMSASTLMNLRPHRVIGMTDVALAL
jgi:hypothetical protein